MSCGCLHHLMYVHTFVCFITYSSNVTPGV
uniref:Uncharacterized protein n=1 Tax=Arundo donax TaxID=35708 RepID=A0A0A9GZH8_ARUDO